MKFSIVTPSFRQLDHLSLCIASVRDQISSDAGTFLIEHIVQDGGSEGIFDFSFAHGVECFKDEPRNPDPLFLGCPYRLSVYSEKDRGMYDAINKGFKKTDGEICAWLNSDEQYLPKTLSRIASFFTSRPDVRIVVGDTIILNHKLEPTAVRIGIPPCRRYLQEYQLNLHSSSLFFRRDLLEEGFWLGDRFRSIGDSEWIARILDAGIQIHRLPVPLSTFVLGQGNLSGNELSRREKEIWRHEHPLSPVEAAIVKFRYTLRRFLTGAFFPRRAGVKIFTPADLQNRKEFPPRWLDFRFRV